MPLKCLSAFAAVLLVASTAAAQLPAGNYTIDPSLPAGGNNYQTWGAATAALAAGVIGPGGLIFTVASTTFNEVVVVNPFTGTSAANPVTFVAVGAPAVIDAGAAQDGLTLNPNSGVPANALQSYLNFENIEIRNFTRYGLNLNGVVITTPAPTTFYRNTFCTFKKITTSGPTTTSTSVMSLRAYYSQDCTFEDCVFKGGGYVMRSESIDRCRFSRCEFDGKGSSSRLVYPFNSNDANNTWDNCFIHDCGPTGLGMDINVSSYGNNFWHNTIIVTTSNQAVLMAGCCAWSRSNSFRNNIVINRGTGVALMYGTTSATAPGNGVLDFNDLDYNCYWAPNGNAVAMQNNNAAFPPGTLASWQTWLAANPAAIPAGGGTNFDQNSIQADPLLVSTTAPYDIHLSSGSPCIDTGTTVYIPGVWTTNPTGYTPSVDFESQPRPATLRDIGADEVICLVPQYETNSAASSVDINGLQGSACIPAVTLLNQNAPGILSFGSSNVGLGWEAVLATANLVPASAGGITLPSGQILNINFGAPAVSYLNGGSFPSFASPFPGNFLLGFNAPPFPFIASIQMANLDPSNPDGLALSQGCELNVP